ncbi:hypothetical protein JW979_09310, partial [bacterium]|nr:hypothetical protein [candidate division CSSED10-310 bacterium]
MNCDVVKKYLTDFSSSDSSQFPSEIIAEVALHLKTCEHCLSEENEREKLLGPILLATALEFGRPELGIPS